MDVGIIGLGRMGSGVAERLLKAGHRVVVYNRSQGKAESLVEMGAIAATSVHDMLGKLESPRVIWLYLPSGDVTDSHVAEILPELVPGDTLIDGGNSRFSDTLEKAATIEKTGVHFIDVGTSGGVTGRKNGYCLMMGGDEGVVERLTPLWQAVAQENGWKRVGPVGSGHYVKMIHNAIEYGMMQSYGEGMELLVNSQFKDHIDIPAIADVWQNGSIISSFLGQLLSEALHEYPALAEIGEKIDDNGEGRWALEEGLKTGVPMPAITAAMYERYASRRTESFGRKVSAVLRKKFGGHAVEGLTSK